MSTEIGELIVKIDLDNTQFAKSVTGLNRQMKAIESEFKAATSTLDKFEDASKRQQIQAQTLAKQIELQREKIKLLKQNYDELVQTKGKDAAETQKAAIRINNAVAALGRLESELKSVNQELNKNQREFQESGKAAEKAGRDFKGAAASVGALALELGLMAKAAAATIAGFAAFRGIRVNAQLENATIAFTTLTKSGEKASKMLEELRQIAAESPFSFEGLQQSAKLLLAMGVDVKNIVPYMRTLGDAVAAVGGGSDELQRVSLAIAQISAKGKVSAEEMNQLAENGIPAWQILSKEMGKSTQELMKMGENGKLFSKDVIPLLIRGLDKQFGGAMERAGQTFDGMLEQIKEQSDIVLGELFEPMFKSLKKVMPKVIDGIKELKDQIEQGGLKEVFKNLLPERLQDNFLEIVGWWDAVKIAIQDADAKTLGALFALRIQQIFNFAWEAVQPYIEDLKKKMSKIDWGKAILDGIKMGRDFIGGFVGMFDEELGKAIELGDPIAIGKRMGELLAKALNAITQNISPLVEPAQRLLLNIFLNINWAYLGLQTAPMLGLFIGGMIQGAIGNVDWSSLGSAIGMALLQSIPVVNIPLTISTNVDEVIGNERANINGFKTDVINKFNEIKSAVYHRIYETVLNVKNQVQDMKQSFYNKLHDMVNDAKQKAKDIKTSIYNKIRELIDQIKSINLVQAGRDIIAGLGKGLSQAAGDVYKKAEGIAKKIKEKIQSALKINSPSRVMIEIGQWIGEGLAIGMERSTALASSRAERMAQAVKSSVNHVVVADSLGFKVDGPLYDAKFNKNTQDILKAYGLDPKVASGNTQININVNANNGSWVDQVIRELRRLNSNGAPNYDLIRALRQLESL